MTISPERQFQMHKPRYNPAQVGCGVIGDVKYNRARQRRADRREIREQMAR